jgi:hypothetical protein
MRRDAQPGQPEAAPDEGSGAPAARRTQASVSATDAISDALEAAEAEEKRTADHAASGARPEWHVEMFRSIVLPASRTAPPGTWSHGHSTPRTMYM